MYYKVHYEYILLLLYVVVSLVSVLPVFANVCACFSWDSACDVMLMLPPAGVRCVVVMCISTPPPWSVYMSVLYMFPRRCTCF
jgi:hypothetical protein